MKTKTIVIYNSKTGYTKKYAKWISEQLNCEMKNASEINQKQLQEYDHIIYGGRIIVGKIKGLKLITSAPDLLKAKKITVFAVGLTPKSDQYTTDLIKANLPAKYRARISFHFFRGGADLNHSGFFTKRLLDAIIKEMQKTETVVFQSEGIVDLTDRSEAAAIMG